MGPSCIRGYAGQWLDSEYRPRLGWRHAAWLSNVMIIAMIRSALNLRQGAHQRGRSSSPCLWILSEHPYRHNPALPPSRFGQACYDQAVMHRLSQSSILNLGVSAQAWRERPEEPNLLPALTCPNSSGYPYNAHIANIFRGRNPPEGVLGPSEGSGLGHTKPGQVHTLGQGPGPTLLDCSSLTA